MNLDRVVPAPFYAIGLQGLELDVVAGWKSMVRRALRGRRAVPFKQTGPAVRFEVLSGLDYEVIALM